jgi:hypothetical protein
MRLRNKIIVNETTLEEREREGEKERRRRKVRRGN